MKRILSTLAISALGIAGTFAAPLSPEEALMRLDDSALGVTPVGTRADFSPRLKLTMKANDGLASLYVFEKGDDAGFMIVSADDCAAPLLGYSDTNFNPENMAPGLKYWLEEYQRQIEFARVNGLSSAGTRAEGIELPTWSAVAPKVKSNWNQDAPYNNMCPLDGNVRSYTGCVATSMAQAMNYFKYPAIGRDHNKYDCMSLKPAQTLEMYFDEQPFDWDNMLDSYLGSYTQQQAEAVAYLMKACGYAVNMSYSSAESGAVSGAIGAAMVKYFNYDEGVIYNSRDMFTYTDWCQMIYNNVKNVGPVLYDGTGNGGGHSFIVDGYQGDGYFHINWGWSGLSDGYYRLDALSPSSLGIGAGTGGYNYNQGAVLNLKPATGTNSPLQSDFILYGSFQGSYTGGTLVVAPAYSAHAGWGYQGIGRITVQLGIGYAPADTPNATPTYIVEKSNSNTPISGQAYIPANSNISFNVNNLNMADGVKYKVVSAYRADGGEWKECPAAVGFFNYFYMTKNGTKYTVENVDPLQFSGSDIKMQTGLYYQCAVKVQATITNPNSTELTRSVALALVNEKNKLAFIGESFVLSLPPNGSSLQVWDTNLTKQSGIGNVISPTNFYPALYDMETGTLYYTAKETVTMQPRPGIAALQVEAVVEDAAIANPDEIGYAGNTIYIVNNAYDFNVKTSLAVTSGYYTNQLNLGIFAPVSGSQFALYNVYPISDYLYMNAGDSEEWVTNINFQTAELDQIYLIGVLNSSMGLATGGNQIKTGILVKGFEAGVESLPGSEGDIYFLYDHSSASLNVTGGQNGIYNVEAYYLNGMKAPLNVEINGENAYVNLSNLGKGVIVVTATDRNGNRKSTKLAL